jgi:membrane fusion protein
VRTISSTVLRPDQIVATIHVEEPVYRVVVALDQDAINAYGQRYRIRSGMALSADIVLDRRSFAQWLLDPIKALRGRL